MEVKLLVPNAIVFLYVIDSEDIQIPEYLDDTLIAANEQCVSIGTQAEVDGEVTIKIWHEIDNAEKNRL